MKGKYYLRTFGCQKNKYDSEVVSAILERKGYKQTGSESDAEIVILNTCCVRDNADQRVYGLLGQYMGLKKNRKDLIVAITGCLAQKDNERLLKRFPVLDIVLGTRNLDELGNAIDVAKSDGGPYISYKMKEMDFESLPVKRESSFSAWIPISEGCNCHCTFCIVPTVRGSLKSRPVSRIIKEIEEFVENQGKEITLLGQNVNSYGADLIPETNFAELLGTVNSVSGLKRIRFTSPHPRNFTSLYIKKMSELDKVCEHIHLPLQSGDDEVLRRMGRNYTSSAFMEIVDNLRRYIPDVSITTDIIVGFPGETEKQFEKTMKMIEDIQFDSAFMFAYSEREGTPAVKIKNSVPVPLRMERLYRLVEKQNDISLKKNRASAGIIDEVLVERISKKNVSYLTGRTRRNKVVNFEGEPLLIGELVQVKLLQAYTWGFKGELV